MTSSHARLTRSPPPPRRTRTSESGARIWEGFGGNPCPLNNHGLAGNTLPPGEARRQGVEEHPNQAQCCETVADSRVRSGSWLSSAQDLGIGPESLRSWGQPAKIDGRGPAGGAWEGRECLTRGNPELRRANGSSERTAAAKGRGSKRLQHLVQTEVPICAIHMPVWAPDSSVQFCSQGHQISYIIRQSHLKAAR
jgi:hypothetical protein